MRVVIKVGTSTLAHKTGRINIRRVEKLCKTLSDLKNEGNEIILVSSGAIGMGLGKLMITERPSDVPTKQAAAAVGQCELMYTYDKLFSEYRHTVAQILLTGGDIDNEEHRKNIQNTLFRLLQLGALPIINENDTVATEEIVIGDNDTLGAVTAKAVNADLLVILSDIDGLFDKDPHRFSDAKLIHKVENLTDEIKSLGGRTGTKLGTGGMITKLKAAEICVNSGVEMVIANGESPECLYDIFEGLDVGTRFLPKK